MNSKQDRVDVLLAAYNGERFLPEQLQSLRRQFHPDFRVLMQDDGSTDGTPALLAQVCREDKRFTLAAHQGCRFGAAGNFIDLMKQSDAPYACLCDQDDVWTPDHILMLLRGMHQLEEQYGADVPLLVMSDLTVTDEQGKVKHISMALHQGWKTEALPLNRLLVQNNATGCTMLMNAPLRRLAAEHAMPEKLFMHDWFIALTAAAFGHAYFEKLSLVDYRQHGQNTLGASGKHQLQRGLEAVKRSDRVRARIALTYEHTAMFRDSYGDALPEEAAACVNAYLATRDLPKRQRVRWVRKGGFTMQSRLTRLAQRIWG